MTLGPDPSRGPIGDGSHPSEPGKENLPDPHGAVEDRRLEDVPDIVKERGNDPDNDIWRAECDQLVSILEEAEEPLTMDQIALLSIDLSKYQVRRRLRHLGEHGRVERVSDEEDGRLVRYALADVQEGEDDA